MDAEKAGKIGKAFALGYVYGHGFMANTFGTVTPGDAS